MNKLWIVMCVCIGLLGIWMPQAKADAWNQTTVVTFNAPVEIPGQVLSPGTYVFKLAESMSDRNVVEVWNKNQTHMYGFFLAIPDYRLKVTGRKPVMTFEERAAGAPEAVKAWFYPGDYYGHEFVYPKVKALELAKANNQTVPSMPNELAANATQPAPSMNEPNVMALKNAPLKAQNSSQQEEELSEAFPPAAPKPAPVMQATNEMPKKLPKTASPLPSIALLGLLSLGVAGSLGYAAGKMKVR